MKINLTHLTFAEQQEAFEHAVEIIARDQNGETMMTEKEFEKFLEEKCCYGTGGSIFREYYREGKENPNAIKEAVEQLTELIEEDLTDTENDIKNGLTDHDTARVHASLVKMQNMPKETIAAILDVFDEFFYECAPCESYPELLGTLIGGCAYHQRYAMARDFLGNNDVMIFFDS